MAHRAPLILFITNVKEFQDFFSHRVKKKYDGWAETFVGPGRTGLQAYYAPVALPLSPHVLITPLSLALPLSPLSPLSPPVLTTPLSTLCKFVDL